MLLTKPEVSPCLVTPLPRAVPRTMLLFSAAVTLMTGLSLVHALLHCRQVVQACTADCLHAAIIHHTSTACRSFAVFLT